METENHLRALPLVRLFPHHQADEGSFPEGNAAALSHHREDDGLAPDIIKSNASIIAEEISGLVVLNVLDQTKASLKKTGIRMEGETRDAVENLLNNQMASVAKKVMPELQPRISEMVSYSINRAMEPYLLSPIGPIVRLILMSVHATVNDGLEAALSGPEGTERLSRILQESVANIMEDMGCGIDCAKQNYEKKLAIKREAEEKLVEQAVELPREEIDIDFYKS